MPPSRTPGASPTRWTGTWTWTFSPRRTWMKSTLRCWGLVPCPYRTAGTRPEARSRRAAPFPASERFSAASLYSGMGNEPPRAREQYPARPGKPEGSSARGGGSTCPLGDGQVQLGRRGAAFLDQVEDGLLDRALVGRLAELGDLAELLEGAGDGQAGAVAVEQPGVDVGGPADGRGVAQVVGDLLDRPADRPGPGRPGPGLGERAGQGDRGQHRGRPGAEVLGGEVAAGLLLDVGVDVLGADVGPGPAAL